MGKHDIYGPQLQELCSTPQGRTLLDLLPLCSAARATILAKLPEMVGLGQLYRAGNRKHYRYFTHRVHRDAWEKQQQQAAANAAAEPYIDPRDIYSKPVMAACSTPNGLEYADISRITGASPGLLGNKLKKMSENGLLHRVGSKRLYRYFTHLADADAWAHAQIAAPGPAATKPRRGPAPTLGTGKAKAAGQPSIARASTVTWPAHVQVQRAPTPRDDRYAFTPPPGWKGELAREWDQLRKTAC